ncbi:uncharacterized protein TNCV_2437001 [Trichonephila clavipes]|nr:uncharacterized protein TNCV_2437001 [Trichonephila clavipes]
MDFTEINSRGKRGELLGRIDRQNSRFRTAKTTIIKFGLHASFVELESAKSPLNEVLDESRSFFRVHTGYFSNIPKCIKAEFIASWACSQSSVVSSSKR